MIICMRFGERINGYHSRNEKLFLRIKHFDLWYRKM